MRDKEDEGRKLRYTEEGGRIYEGQQGRGTRMWNRKDRGRRNKDREDGGRKDCGTRRIERGEMRDI
jgi:hypothetical protein